MHIVAVDGSHGDQTFFCRITYEELQELFGSLRHTEFMSVNNEKLTLRNITSPFEFSLATQEKLKKRNQLNTLHKAFYDKFKALLDQALKIKTENEQENV